MRATRYGLIAHFISIVPAILLVIDHLFQNLTANPIQAVTLRTGRAAIHLLLVSLACTPMSRIFGLTALAGMRKIFGLYTFFYSLIHFLVFIGLDYQFNWNWIINELSTKPFLQIGLAALVILFLLAISSINVIRRWLKKGWKGLQRTVYLAAGLIIWHTILAAKGDFFAASIRGLLFLILMLARARTVQDRLVIRVKWVEGINRFLLNQ